MPSIAEKASQGRGILAGLEVSTFRSEQSIPGPSPAPLPLSKLRGIPETTRRALKRQKITTCPRLLAAAGNADQRAALAQTTGIAPDLLTTIVQRADMERVHGIGTIFDLMLEEAGVYDVATLAQQDAAVLHLKLKTYNQRERLARRSPTLEEVEHWVEQARALPVLVSY